MLQAHVCGDASAVVSEEAQPKLLVVNHMASLCFHTPLHRVLYRHKGWKKSGMRDVQTSRESWQLHPCSSLSANFTKAKPLEEPSGNRLMSTLSTCSCFHLEHDFLRLAAPGQCPRTCKESWERSWEEIGLIRAHFHSISFMFIEFYWVYCIEFKNPAVIPPGHTLQSDQWPCLHWYFFAGRQQRQWWPRPVDHSTWKVTCREAMTPLLDCELTISRAGQRMSKTQSWDSFRL